MSEHSPALESWEPAGVKRVNAMTGRWLVAALAALALVVGIGISARLLGWRLEDLAGLGYLGVFLVMAISGASIFLPVAGQAAVLAGGAMWNPLLVGLVAGMGNAVGELTGYAAGRAGAAVRGPRRNPRWWRRVDYGLRRSGFVVIVVLALIPNPVFDVVGILAGALGYPIRRFLIACIIGNSVKYTVIAVLGRNTFLWLDWQS